MSDIYMDFIRGVAIMLEGLSETTEGRDPKGVVFVLHGPGNEAEPRSSLILYAIGEQADELYALLAEHGAFNAVKLGETKERVH